jgi:hypothetical protein
MEFVVLAAPAGVGQSVDLISAVPAPPLCALPASDPVEYQVAVNG